jgi:hypothetical protein
VSLGFVFAILLSRNPRRVPCRALLLRSRSGLGSFCRLLVRNPASLGFVLQFSCRGTQGGFPAVLSSSAFSAGLGSFCKLLCLGPSDSWVRFAILLRGTRMLAPCRAFLLRSRSGLGSFCQLLCPRTLRVLGSFCNSPVAEPKAGSLPCSPPLLSALAWVRFVNCFVRDPVSLGFDLRFSFRGTRRLAPCRALLLCFQRWLPGAR